MVSKIKTEVKIIAIILSIIAVLTTAVLCFNPIFVVSADSQEYSDVLVDLKKDESFNKADYPSNSKDYSINVIQLAESADKELLIYTYQPSANSKSLTASSINIAETDELSFKNYKLTLLNTNGVFQKYVVKDYKVSDYKVRYYYITSIYRPFDSTIDKDADHGNHITEVETAVSKQYRLTEADGKSYCDVLDIETITVTDKFVGFVRYFDGYHLFGSGSCDSHFVAFNTDRPIDKLLEADVYYTKQRYKFTNNSSLIDWIFPDDTTFYNVEEEYAYLKYTDRVIQDGSGFGFGDRHYEWDRIQTVDQFVAENTSYKNVYSGALLNVNMGSEITAEGKAALKGKKWVLRFAETSFSINTMSSTSQDHFGTIVGNVTILRLKFETAGKVYNLGVIDNKQSGSDKPVNSTWTDVELTGLGKFIGIMLVAILLIVVLLPLFPSIIGLLLLPFKAIARVIKSIKNNSKRGS